MIPRYLSPMWAEIPPALGNHLWQSTLFCITAGLLTLILGRNHARARYWVWLTASVKFLIPFSLIVDMGRRLASPHSPLRMKSGFYSVIEEVGLPVAQRTTALISHTSPSTASPSAIHMLPLLLSGLWFRGFVTVLFVQCTRWRRISAALRTAVPLREGREVQALRARSVLYGYGSGSRCYRHKLLQNQVSSASRVPFWYGRNESPSGSKSQTWIEFLLMRYGTYAVATIWPLRYTWWLKASFGFTLWFGGCVRGWWRSAKAPATKKRWIRATHGKSMPRAF
jgi:hypothetical protein